MRSTGLVATVRASLRELGVPRAGDTVVVGLSGGADSVALLDCLAALRQADGFHVVAAHLDHGLRPDSAADAAFCASVCAALDVPFRTERADVRGRCRRDRLGLEDAAREERYAFLRRSARAEGASVVAIAHNRDDQAETVLLHLLRGAGSQGLGGMRARTADLIRPLLAVSRAQVVAHLEARGLTWREDATNADPAFTRNRVRHELLPFLEARFNPNVRETLARVAALLADEAATVEDEGRVLFDRVGRVEPDAVALDCAGLVAAPRPLARAAVRLALDAAGGRRGVGAGHVERILALAAKAASGRRLPLPGGREAVVAFGALRLRRRAPARDFACPLDVPGRVALPDGSLVRARSSSGPAVSNRETAVVAAPEGRLEVRTRRPGDRVRARGREMSLRRFLMGRRMPLDVRESLPLVASGAHVLWIPGQPTDAWVPEDRGRYVQLEVTRA